MEGIVTWYESLDTLLQVYWACAGISSLIFIIQFVLTLIGMDSVDMDVDVDAGDTLDLGGGLSLFTVRNVVNFFVGFGWAGISLHSSIPNPLVLTLVSTVVGLLFVVLFFLLRKQILKLETNGAVSIQQCEGKIADVYLRIPAAGEGKGKVQVSLNGSVHEFDALSAGEPIRTGSKVRVVEIVDSSTVKVESV